MSRDTTGGLPPEPYDGQCGHVRIRTGERCLLADGHNTRHDYPEDRMKERSAAGCQTGVYPGEGEPVFDARHIKRATAGDPTEEARAAGILVKPEDYLDRLIAARRDAPDAPPAPRCTVCGASRIVGKDGKPKACSLVPGRDGKGGCPDPTHDYDVEHGLRSADPLPVDPERQNPWRNALASASDPPREGGEFHLEDAICPRCGDRIGNDAHDNVGDGETMLCMGVLRRASASPDVRRDSYQTALEKIATSTLCPRALYEIAADALAWARKHDVQPAPVTSNASTTEVNWKALALQLRTDLDAAEIALVRATGSRSADLRDAVVDAARGMAKAHQRWIQYGGSFDLTRERWAVDDALSRLDEAGRCASPDTKENEHASHPSDGHGAAAARRAPRAGSVQSGGGGLEHGLEDEPRSDGGSASEVPLRGGAVGPGRGRDVSGPVSDSSCADCGFDGRRKHPNEAYDACLYRDANTGRIYCGEHADRRQLGNDAVEISGPDPIDPRDEVLSRLSAWTFEYGEALKPTGADTYGEGVRACKGQVARILATLTKSAAKVDAPKETK